MYREFDLRSGQEAECTRSLKQEVSLGSLNLSLLGWEYSRDYLKCDQNVMMIFRGHSEV